MDSIMFFILHYYFLPFFITSYYSLLCT